MRDSISQFPQKMVAHSQFCQSGDNTLESAEIAIKNILQGYEKEKQYLRSEFHQYTRHYSSSDTFSFFRMPTLRGMESLQVISEDFW